MADEKRQIDELFKDYLSGYKAKAPEGAWDRLQEGLRPAKKRVQLLYLRLAAASILLLMAFTAGYFWSEFNNTDKNTTISEIPKSVQPKDSPGKVLENSSSQALPFGSSDGLASKETLKEVTDSDPGKIKSSQIAKSRVSPVIQDEKQAAVQNQLALSESEDVAEIAVLDENAETASNEDIGKTEGLTENNNQLNKTAEPEKMSPEMLHQLLVGNDEAFADDIIQKSNKQQTQQWSVGAQFSPVYSYRNLNGDGFSTPDEQVDQEYFNNTENGLMAYAGGISLNYGFNDRLSLASGLYLSRIGQENEDVVAYDSPESQYLYKLASSSGTVTINPIKFEKVMVREIDNTKDSTPGDYIVSGTFVQNLDYLEVPLVLKYKMLDNRFSVNLSGGLSPGILVNNRSYFSIDGEKVQTGFTENIKPVIYNSVMGLGVEYAVSSKLSINLDPLFKYSLSPVNSNSGLKYHPYSISWFTGITYKL